MPRRRRRGNEAVDLRVSAPGTVHLLGAIDRIDLPVVARQRAPEPILDVVFGFTSETYQIRTLNEKSNGRASNGVDPSRTASHDWVRMGDLRPTGTHASNRVAIGEPAIRVGDEGRWMYAPVGPNPTAFPPRSALSDPKQRYDDTGSPGPP